MMTASNIGFRSPAITRITRRSLLGSLAVVATVRPSHAASPDEFGVPSPEGDIGVTRYAAKGTAKRPGVLLLHGARGVEIQPRAYERDANALADAGIDAHLVRYYSTVDEQALARASTKEARLAHNDRRFVAWAERVSSVVTAVLARPESTGRVGLLGFSLGGFIAATTAARDERVAALAVLYGGMPDAIAPSVTHMPPLLALHGDADRNVPLAEGEALVRLAKTLGAPAELVTYPGKPHGFDFADNDPAAVDALSRVAGFFRERLLAA